MNVLARRVQTESTSVFSSPVVRPSVQFSGATTRLVVSEPQRQWREAVVSRFNELCSLPSGWDGYKAGPVSFDTANFSLRMLETACVANIKVPSVVPGTRGDLQIEWHLDSGDVELHVIAPNRVHAWRCNEATGEDGQEVNLTNDFTIVAAWLNDLLEPAVDRTRAAA